jgi:hypothetical protein
LEKGSLLENVVNVPRVRRWPPKLD